MNIKLKRVLVLIGRIGVAVVAPLIIFATKFDVFQSTESVGVFGLLCLGTVGFFALKGIMAGTLKCIPSKYAYIPKMLQFPFGLSILLGMFYAVGQIGPQIMYSFGLVLVFNVISMPLTIWYNRILYQIYGDAVIDHLEAGMFDIIKEHRSKK